MAWREPALPKRFAANKLGLEIRLKLGLLASLERQLQALTATLQTLARQVDKLEQELTQLILDQQHHHQAAQRLQSIPGISSTVAACIVQFLDVEACHHPKQWIAFVGLDISVRESGQWRGRGKLTKRGNPYLRKRLYSAAWGAVMNYPDFRHYYDQLKSQGKTHVEALLTIARKLLRIAFTLLKHQQSYTPQCAFPS
jgi:transposase